MDQRRTYGWLMLAGYLGLALAMPALTPAVPEQEFWPPIAPVVMSETSADEAMMQPLRAQANAAMRALQAGQQTASLN